MTKLAFLGTGLIGAGMVEAAIRRGDQVTAWNRSTEKLIPLVELGASAAAMPREAVKHAERVHLALTDDAAVDAVINAIADHVKKTAVIVDHTTASPAGTKTRAEKLEARGIAFVHAPIFMSPKMCREAGGLMLASAPRAVFERVESGLKQMTGTLEYLGERRELAAAYKLFGNAMILTIVGGLADVYAMAKSLDIPAPDAHSLFSKFNPGMTVSIRGALMAQGNFTPSFEMKMARKDLRLMIETGAELGVLPTLATWMDQLIKEGHGGLDVGALAIKSTPQK